jgi:endonuclease G, mitochondrial
MGIDSQLYLGADNRYQLREYQRKANIQKLADTDLLSVDTPERVKKRLARVSKNPLAQMMIAEYQKTTTGHTDPLSNSEFQQLVQERILGMNDLMPVSYLEYALRVSQSVGRVNVRSNSRRIIGYGTGSMVSPRLLITNNHVLSNIGQSQYSQIEFNFQSSLNGEMRPSQIFDLDPDTFFLTDPKLDYTIVAVKDNLDSPTSLSSIGWNRLIEEEGKVVIGEYVNIIQHPSGEPKQLALRENQVVDLLDDFLHYLTDTAPGSSGAPVFNDQWELLGIHHSGVPQRDSQGNILTIDGGIWRQSMGESR